MKKFLTFIIVILAIVFPAFSGDSQGNGSNTTEIKLDTDKKGTSTSPIRDRMPIHIDIQAWYDAEAQNIVISYDGEQAGEVYLYLDGMPAGYSSEINTVFPVLESGLYSIEILGEDWVATGEIQIGE